MAMSPEAKVRELIYRYRPIQVLHPIVAEMYDAPEFERMFWECLTHDLHIIRQRSQDLADGEITANQKAFRILMEGKDDGTAAIELYVNEIIGLEAVSENAKAQTLATALQTRDYILSRSYHSKRSCSPQQTFQGQLDIRVARTSHSPPFETTQVQDSRHAEGSQSSSLTHSRADRHKMSFSDEDLDSPPERPNTDSSGKEMLRKLFTTYQQAKEDFHASPRRSSQRTRSAKFLRDTTENCLAYLATRQSAPHTKEPFKVETELPGGEATVVEMKSTLQEAIEAAESGSGGKKRRFDEDWSAVPEAPATMRPVVSSEHSKPRDPVPRGTTSDHPPLKRFDHRYAEKSSSPSNDRYRARRITQSERVPRGLYPASAGRGTRRVFPFLTQSRSRPLSKPLMEHGDCYRPAYK